MKVQLFIALAAMGLLTAGCETVRIETRADRMAQLQDRLIEQENQRRMAGRIETLEMEIGQLNRDLQQLRSDLENRCNTIEQKSEEDKRELITRLSSELDKLAKQVASVPAAPAGGTQSGYGYEHIVQPGETLSTIAKAYSVTTKTIIQANKIKNPNLLSVGQKLFIPE